MATKSAQIVARFSGARKIAVMEIDGQHCARWGVNTGIDTWHGLVRGADYADWWLGDDGHLRMILPDGLPFEFVGLEALSVSYRTKFEGRSTHFRHEFKRDNRPLIHWNEREKVLTLIGGNYRVTANGIQG